MFVLIFWLFAFWLNSLPCALDERATCPSEFFKFKLFVLLFLFVVLICNSVPCAVCLLSCGNSSSSRIWLLLLLFKFKLCWLCCTCVGCSFLTTFDTEVNSVCGRFLREVYFDFFVGRLTNLEGTDRFGSVMFDYELN